MEKFDIIVVGSGPGGYVAAIKGAQLGKSVAIVERAEIGGVCLNWGCIPTKALLKSAQAYNYAVHSAAYGFEASEVKADISKMVERSRGVAAQMSKGVEFLIKKNKITLIQGDAMLKSGHTLEVTADSGEKTMYEADHIILAVGSRPNSLPFAPIDGNRIISYRQALVPEKLPKSLAVIGSGAIGSEFAFFYRSLGVDVYLIEYVDRILPLEDDEVSAQVSRSFRKAGIKVMVSAQVKNVDTAGEHCKLTVQTKKGEEIIEAETVLSAVGVIPNTDYLGLEELGVEMVRGNKIKVDEHYRTNVEGIYAIGDIIPTPALAHVASAEGINCVEAIAGLNPKPIDYTNIPGCTFTSPEVASVGMTERAAKEQGIDYKVGKFFFIASGKAVAAGEKDGFVKLIVDSVTDKVLGAHLVGANVTEMVSGIVTGRTMGMTAADIICSVHPHPTMSEAIMEAAEASHGNAIHQ